MENISALRGIAKECSAAYFVEISSRGYASGGDSLQGDKELHLIRISPVINKAENNFLRGCNTALSPSCGPSPRSLSQIPPNY